MLPMYAPIANSPSTVINISLGIDDTTITLVDASVLPPAPNICTIGYNTSSPETILYPTNPVDNMLSGVTRGFQGTPQAWPSESSVARAFTAYDYSSVIENLSELQGLCSTGLISGGSLTINATDSTKFDLSAGTGIIVDNYTDPTTPILTPITWPDMIGNVDPMLGSATTSWVGINASGLQFSQSSFTSNQLRSIISLGWNDHPEETQIDTSFSEPQWPLDIFAQMSDFINNFGNFNIVGNEFYPSATDDMVLARTAGQTFEFGSNFSNNAASPNIFSTNLEDPITTLNYYYRDVNGDWVNTLTLTDVDPNNYDSGLGLAAVPAGYWTVQIITYYAPEDSVDIQYGQTTYATYGEAYAALTAPVILNPFNRYDTFRSWLIIQQGTTNISNTAMATFVSAGKLGLISVAAGGGSGGEINTASNQGLTGVGLFIQKLGVDLQFKSIEAGSNRVTVTDDHSNNAVSIDVVQGQIDHTQIAHIGTNTHAQIDSALASDASAISTLNAFMNSAPTTMQQIAYEIATIMGC